MASTAPRRSHRPQPYRGHWSGNIAPSDDLDALTDAFVTTARALVALAVRSLNASPVEVTLPQHRVLVLLASRGEQTVGALAEQLGVNASNASRVCDRLQRLGLVARRRSTSDARSVKVALTEAGMEVLQVVTEHRRTAVRHILSSVAPRIAQGTVEALRTFNDAAHEVADSDWVPPEAVTPTAEYEAGVAAKGTV